MSAESTHIAGQIKPAIAELKEFWEMILESNSNVNCQPLHKAIIRLQLIKDLDNNYINSK